MDKNQARRVLIEALVKDFVQGTFDDGAYIYEVARNGHEGFNRRSDNEIIQNVLDMGLQEQFPSVTEAIEVLESSGS